MAAEASARDAMSAIVSRRIVARTANCEPRTANRQAAIQRIRQQLTAISHAAPSAAKRLRVTAPSLARAH